jgi:GGDEF domain-containing protein
MGLPRRFEVVGEALVSGSDPVPVCSVVGREVARDGASVEEALEGLRETWQAAASTDPDFASMSAFLVAWSETTLGYLNQLSCEDPLTGLSSPPHLRTRLSELYRTSPGDLNDLHALVVCELPAGPAGEDDQDHFTRAMRLTRLGEQVRTVFPHAGTAARLGTVRVAALVERNEVLGRRVRLLRTLVAGSTPPGRPVRVWIEGLPSSDHGAAMLLDELSRR